LKKIKFENEIADNKLFCATYLLSAISFSNY